MSAAFEEPIPLIIVEGFFGGTGSILWRNFGDYLNLCFDGSNRRRRTIFADIGPISSLHDRACELFYSIKGGRVDYGEEHSKTHAHLRYGRTHKDGLYPQWSATRPLHFLGHSVGGCTIVKLQDLIRQGFFGEQHHPNMLLSISTISAPFRGSQVVYVLGESTDDVPFVKQLSPGSILAKGFHLFTYISPFLPSILDFHAESHPLTYKDISIWTLFKNIWRSEWAEGADATPFDVTFQAANAREANEEGVVNEGTFYSSYVASMTTRQPDGTHVPDTLSLSTLPVYLISKAMGCFDFSSVKPPPSFSAQKQDLELEPFSPTVRLEDEYFENDGVVPTFSQWHPLPCSETRCQHRHSKASPGLMSGVWNVFNFEGTTTHLSIVPFWTGTSQQTQFFENLGTRLFEMEEKWKLMT